MATRYRFGESHVPHFITTSVINIAVPYLPKGDVEHRIESHFVNGIRIPEVQYIDAQTQALWATLTESTTSRVFILSLAQ